MPIDIVAVRTKRHSCKVEEKQAGLLPAPSSSSSCSSPASGFSGVPGGGVSTALSEGSIWVGGAMAGFLSVEARKKH
jgi:hypothetical protein